MHPTLRILALILLAVTIQFLEAPALMIVGGIVLAIALFFHAGLLRKMLHRSRWLLLTLLLIFAFTTPGEYLEWGNPKIAPTYEGISLGLLQAGRLAMMLAGLAILLGTTPRNALMAGIFLLLKPLRPIGISPEQFTARLWLTMHYVEQEPRKGKGKFWARLDNAALYDNAAAIECVRFTLPSFTHLDWAILVLTCLVSGWWLA